MSITLALALASASAVPAEPSCSWDRPGHNPYRGSIGAAIDRYTDIPPAVASTLKRRMTEQQPDDNVIITRDAITGRERYAAQIRDMHFGAASVCHSVTRSGWSERRQEPAKVYCVGQVCILVPKICGNISRITRLEAPASGHAAYAGATAGQAPAAAALPTHRSVASAAPPAANPAAPLRSAMRPLADTAPAPAVPQFELDTPTPAEEVAQAELEDADRNRLPGRTTVGWQATDTGWHNPGRDSGGGGGGGGDSIPAPVPEPSTGAMLALGLAGVALLQRLRRKDKNR